MQFIISPSKTLTMKDLATISKTHPIFLDEAKTLYQLLKGYSRDELKILMKIKGELLDDTYDTYQDYPNLTQGQALASYTGLVFKYLDITTLSPVDMRYLNDHLLILDAMYGVLRPSDVIMPYRLDFKMPLEKNLYNYWNIDRVLKDNVIINLASKEYAKLLPRKPEVTISFKENKNGKYRTIGTYAKMARGMFLRFCAQKHISDINALKTFNKDGYHFNKTLSNAQHFVFTRTSK
ncbi:MAG: YaaA family protein [Candidatus Izemoplasma sp.]|nr:YaaA family protein [Candidatus Izemoplasma sp.]